jgi:hypothetical protein
MTAIPQVTASVEQFLTVVRAHRGASAATALRQSMEQWRNYYRSLGIILSGGNHPAVIEFIPINCYPFAQAVLDDFTVTVCTFFACPWPRADMTHARLTRDFADLCRAYRLQGPLADVHAFMRNLYVRVVAHRTGSAASNMHAYLSDILTCIEQYIVAMLRLCERTMQPSFVWQHTGSARGAGASG